MGTDTEFGRPNLLTRWTCPSAGRAAQAGCGAHIWGQTRCRVYPVWGQTRCPIYRSRTFNVQRSTLDFQQGDRKGGWWAEYGDRHGIWTTGLWPGGPVQAPAGRVRPAVAPGYGDRHDVGYTRYGDRHDVRYTDHERSTSNAQLSTFNGVTERADGGRNMGTDTEFGRPDFGPVDLSKRRSGGPSRLWRPHMGTDTMSGTRYGDRHGVRYADQERSTSNRSEERRVGKECAD